jgi:DNA repair protein RecN (Recombination protein N)
MLHQLTLQHVALHATLEVTFAPGFSVLTGETGAGKSMLLEGLTLALGARADASLIAPGQPQAEATASFTHWPASVAELLAEHDITLTPDEALLCRRVLKRDGPSRAWLQGTPVSLGVLQQVGAELLDFHGQHSQQALLHASQQRDVLDSLGGLMLQRRAVEAAYAAWQTAQHAWHSRRQQLQQATHEAELRTAWLTELRTLNYQPDEEAELLTRRQRVQHAAQRQAGFGQAALALEGEGGALPALHQALRAVRSVLAVAPEAEALHQRLESAQLELSDIAAELQRLLLDADQTDDVTTLDDRLHALRQVARKHNVAVDHLPEVLQRLEDQASAVAEGEAGLATLQAAATQAEHAYHHAAQALGQGRRQAAVQLHTAVQAQLAALHMPHARFAIQLDDLPAAEWAAHGQQRVTFQLAANPGHPMQPLAKVASGGELSRLMLALKVACYAGLSPRTVVLDEIDTGLAGPTAHAVGLALRQLAQQHQVLVISHHAQVAALAAQHLHVVKQVDATPTGPTTRTQVQVLTSEARVAALAHLLAGETVTPAATAAAAALLAA